MPFFLLIMIAETAAVLLFVFYTTPGGRFKHICQHTPVYSNGTFQNNSIFCIVRGCDVGFLSGMALRDGKDVIYGLVEYGRCNVDMEGAVLISFSTDYGQAFYTRHLFIDKIM